MIERQLAKTLTAKKLTLSIAESCTGGLIADSLTDIPGSSKYLALGVVAYSNEAKNKVLGVPKELIKKHGAVSKETAMAMSRNIRRLGSSAIGLGVTGIAGPGGGSASKPVGIVFISASLGPHTYFKKYRFSGNRASIKKQAKDAALRLLQECLS